jgi:hypothetical protein
VVLATGTASAEGPDPSSGFLTDYALLKPSVMGQLGQYVYIAPGITKQLATFNAVFVDAPAFSIAPDSKVKTLQPNDVAVITNALHSILVQQLTPGYIMAVRPDPGVVTMRVALTNVHLQKPRRRLLSFTPVGIVVHGVREATESVMQKIDLTQAVVQGELVDDNTGQMLFEVYSQMGNADNSKQFTSWDQVEAAFTTQAKRLACNLNNARQPPEAQTNCWQITSP